MAALSSLLNREQASSLVPIINSRLPLQLIIGSSSHPALPFDALPFDDIIDTHPHRDHREFLHRHSPGGMPIHTCAIHCLSFKLGGASWSRSSRPQDMVKLSRFETWGKARSSIEDLLTMDGSMRAREANLCRGLWQLCIPVCN